MKLLFLINLIGLSVLLQGCNTLYPMRISAIPDQKQAEFVVNGREAVSSVKNHYVSLSPYRKVCSSTGKTSYVVFVQNLGDNEIEFGPENIDIEFNADTNSVDVKDIQIQSYDEILGEIETNERNRKNALTWAAVGIKNTFTAVRNFYSHEDDQQEQNVSGAHQDVQEISLDIKNTGTLPIELAQKNDESFRHYLNHYSSQAKSKKDILDNVFMTSQKIMPGQFHGGLIVSNTKEMNHTNEGIFTMTVTVDGEQHIFSVDRRALN